MIPESVRSLLSTGPLAHLTTLNSNGSPQRTIARVRLGHHRGMGRRLGDALRARGVALRPRVGSEPMPRVAIGIRSQSTFRRSIRSFRQESTTT